MALNRLMGAFEPPDPRVTFWKNSNLWPANSKDYVFAARAVVELGRAWCGSAWTDDVPATVLSWELPPALNLYTPLEDIRRGVHFLGGVEGSYRSRMPMGALFSLGAISRSPFPTEAEWTQAVALARETAEQTWSAYLPFVNVAVRLADACKGGLVKTATRPLTGGEPIAQEWHFWNSERQWLRFETCRIDPNEPFNVISGRSGNSWLFVEQKTLNELLAGRPTSGVPTVAVEAEIKDQVRKARAAGRPTRYAWDEMMGEFGRMIHEGEVFAGKATRQIASELVEWATSRWDEIPDLKTVEDKVRVWRSRLEDAG